MLLEALDVELENVLSLMFQFYLKAVWLESTETRAEKFLIWLFLIDYKFATFN